MLRNLRKSRGLTQSQLGYLIGVTKSTISDWERNRYIMNVEHAKALAVKLGCEIDDLYEWVIRRKP